MEETIAYKVAAFVALAGGGLVACAEIILPSDPHIQYMGRIDTTTNANTPNFGWAGTIITENFQGTSLKGVFKSTQKLGKDYLQVMIDGVMTTNVFIPPKNALASGLSDTNVTPYHTAVIIKRTEYWGIVTFTGLITDTHRTLVAPPARPPHRIEFYGDSNPSSHDNEDINDAGDSKANNARLGYPGATARMLNA